MILKDIFHPISINIKLAIQAKKWKNRNPLNNVKLLSLCNIDKISVGKGSYGDIDVHCFHNPDEKLVIGNYCSLANGCHFILGGEHNLKMLSTFPFTYYLTNSVINDSHTKGPILIDDDVWIGYGVTILSGVHIGQGAVVAAGSVVTKDVEAYSIVGGVPAKFIKSRFDEKMVSNLLCIQFDNLDKDILNEHINDLTIPLISTEQLDWLLEMSKKEI